MGLLAHNGGAVAEVRLWKVLADGENGVTIKQRSYLIACSCPVQRSPQLIICNGKVILSRRIQQGLDYDCIVLSQCKMQRTSAFSISLSQQIGCKMNEKPRRSCTRVAHTPMQSCLALFVFRTNVCAACPRAYCIGACITCP